MTSFRPSRAVPASIALALVLLAAAVAPAHEGCLAGKLELAAAAGSKAFDTDTGRNLRNFPPDRVVDHRHMKLEMRFDDLDDMRFTAVETLTFVPIGTPTQSLRLDAVGLAIDSVRRAGQPVDFYQDDETVTLRFDPPLAPGTEYSVVIAYTCDHPYAGMYFSPDAPGNPAYTAEVHTQGQTVTNRHWFVCHDAPNERLTTELIVDVPAGNAVSSNGRLVSSFVNGDRAVWHWLQDKPHVSYLVSLVIGRFDIVEIPHERVPMKVWVPEGLGELVPGTYGRTGEMLDVFERCFGLAYPWDRYDQLVVKNFGAGGMENTSATTMYPSAILDETALEEESLEGLIAHELAHQWAGDLITCKDWAHIWLNEGFATYGSALWYEHRDGEDGYLNAIYRSFGVARRDRTTDEVGMVSPIYGEAWETFRRRANPYPKGSSILHMLRCMLGDEIFWKGVHLYMNRHAYGVVETSDFRYALEEVSGRGLEWFFKQWCERPGSPALDVAIAFDGASRELRVDVEQTQHIDARTPAFRFELPIHVVLPGGPRTLAVAVEEQSTTFRATLDSMPEMIVVDPHLHVLATFDIDKPERLRRRQAEAGPTIVARRRAVEALADKDTPDHRALLGRIVRDRDLHEGLRNEAVAALTGYGSEEARDLVFALLDEGIAEPKVRIRLVGALDDYGEDIAVERLAAYAGSDPSYGVREAAIRGLERLEAKDHADLIVELVDFPSQHDEVRRAALGALAAFDDPRGLDLALAYASYGHMDRARPAAIRAVGALAEHDRDRAVEALIDLLDDPQRRPANAAGAALVEIGDERGLAPLEAMANSHPDPDRRERAEGWVETLRERMKEEERAEADEAGGAS